ncbi:uncharacterized protein VTP21DRAFT_7398 [Calcarisporiella thermophila]|uniref:uncharacterized protein n=1 Tax=Calcarisporiella thermophila TaxID=911321 RepID=UPI0037436558
MLQNLPPEIATSILLLLTLPHHDLDSLLTCRLVSKRWNEFTQDSIMWRRLCEHAQYRRCLPRDEGMSWQEVYRRGVQCDHRWRKGKASGMKKFVAEGITRFAGAAGDMLVAVSEGMVMQSWCISTQSLLCRTALLSSSVESEDDEANADRRLKLDIDSGLLAWCSGKRAGVHSILDGRQLFCIEPASLEATMRRLYLDGSEAQQVAEVPPNFQNIDCISVNSEYLVLGFVDPDISGVCEVAVYSVPEKGRHIATHRFELGTRLDGGGGTLVELSGGELHYLSNTWHWMCLDLARTGEAAHQELADLSECFTCIQKIYSDTYGNGDNIWQLYGSNLGESNEQPYDYEIRINVHHSGRALTLMIASDAYPTGGICVEVWRDSRKVQARRRTEMGKRRAINSERRDVSEVVLLQEGRLVAQVLWRYRGMVMASYDVAASAVEPSAGLRIDCERDEGRMQQRSIRGESYVEEEDPTEGYNGGEFTRVNPREANYYWGIARSLSPGAVAPSAPLFLNSVDSGNSVSDEYVYRGYRLFLNEPLDYKWELCGAAREYMVCTMGNYEELLINAETGQTREPAGMQSEVVVVSFL